MKKTRARDGESRISRCKSENRVAQFVAMFMFAIFFVDYVVVVIVVV